MRRIVPNLKLIPPILITQHYIKNNGVRPGKSTQTNTSIARCQMVDKEDFLKRNTPQNIVFQEGADGVRYRDTKMGSGRLVKPGRHVRIHYEVKMLNGRIIEQSRQGITSPFIQFVAGEFDDVPCLNHCVDGMREGGCREVIVPAHIAHPVHRYDFPSALAFIYEVELAFVTIIPNRPGAELTEEEEEHEKLNNSREVTLWGMLTGRVNSG